MATSKSTSKKPTPKKTASKPTTSRPKAKVATKTPVKSKKQTKAAKVTGPQTLRLCEDQQQFMEFKLTKQTVYWAIIAGLVLALGLWIFSVQNQVHNIYDQINQATIEDQQRPILGNKINEDS